MDKFGFARLWDLYRNLLTLNQQEIADMYFNLDLTVSEIAEQKGITRQAASECIAGCKRQLEDYESKLGLTGVIARSALVPTMLISAMSQWGAEFFGAHPELEEDQKRFTEVLYQDYGEAIKATLEKFKQV